jgi:hypothetical protein
VANDKQVPYILSEGKIGYKDHDSLNFLRSFGYQTIFAHFKEYDNGNISPSTLKSNLAVHPNCGRISYAELPVRFDVILGVTGTLKSLSSSEKKVLTDRYSIEKYSFVPSVYGTNRLTFSGDNERGELSAVATCVGCRLVTNTSFIIDVLLCDSKEDQFLELRLEIDRRRKPTHGSSRTTRAVMIFLDSRNSVQDFYNSEHMADLKSQGVVRTITETISASEKESAFLQATQAGAITLMIRDFGRGTDFKCFDSKMLDAGGVHVIQAFFSIEISEEIQIKGRTARQGAEGSYR